MNKKYPDWCPTCSENGIRTVYDNRCTVCSKKKKKQTLDEFLTKLLSPLILFCLIFLDLIENKKRKPKRKKDG